MVTEEIVARYEGYFRDLNVGDGLLRAPYAEAQQPYSSPAVRNIRTALRSLGYDLGPGDAFDADLEKAVLRFQSDFKHNVIDGQVGPGTRARLTRAVLDGLGHGIFERMQHPGGERPPVAFLSYAWADLEVVNKVDQWLQDHGVRVLRDTRDFAPGQQLPAVIASNIEKADKVIAVYSSNSKGRDWTTFEIKVAERTEERSRQPVLIYLAVDDTPLPSHDPHRLAVKARGKTLKQVGDELLHGILGRPTKVPRYEYDENEVVS